MLPWVTKVRTRPQIHSRDTFLTISHYLYNVIIMSGTPNLNVAFSALADPTRRAILARLAKGEATVMELAKPFEMEKNHEQVDSEERGQLCSRPEWKPEWKRAMYDWKG